MTAIHIIYSLISVSLVNSQILHSRIGADYNPDYCGLSHYGIDPLCSVFKAPEDDKSVTNRILGGSNVRSGELPFMASLTGENWEHKCGAALIRKDWAISSAHCIKTNLQNLQKLRLRVGSINRESGGQSLTVKAFHAHPEFDMSLNGVAMAQQMYDIMLIHLEKPYVKTILNESFVTNDVCLPAEDIVNTEPEEGLFAGWGAIERSDQLNPEAEKWLRKARFEIWSNEKCDAHLKQQGHNDISGDRFICANNSIPAVCVGDAGGPLVQAVKGRLVLIGIASTTAHRTDSEEDKSLKCRYGEVLFVRVSKLIEWIVTTIADASN